MTSRPARLRRLGDLARSVASTLDLEAALRQVTEAVVTLRPDLRCVIRLVDAAAGGYRLGAAGGASVRSVPDVLSFGSGLTDAVARSRQPLLLLEAADDPRTEVEIWAGMPGLSVYYGLPIEAGDTLLGVLNILFPGGAPPDERERDEIALLAGHAAVAIRNAQLFAESEARRRVAEALADVGRAFAQAQDPSVVGQRIADNLRALLDSQLAVLYRIDGDSGSLISVAVSGPGSEALGPHVVIPSGSGVVGIAVRERRAVHATDVLADPRLEITPDVRARILRAGHRAVCAVPLAIKDRITGALGIGDRVGRVFRQDEIRLVQAFADQAALALENARLYQESERRRTEAELLVELARRVAASPDLDTILQRVVEGARELAGSDLAHIAVRDPDSGAMVFRYWAGLRYHGPQAYRVEPGRGIGGQVLLTGRPCRTANYAEDPRITKEFLPTIQAEAIVTSMAVPIQIAERVEGLLFVDNRAARPFTDRDEALLLGLADHAAVAMNNARILARERVARRDAESVDDEADTRELVTEVLEARGALVSAVATVTAAVEAIPRGNPHVLLADIGMPGEDGFALIRWLRRREARHGGRVPAVALTAYARPEDRARVLGAGFDSHLAKPVDPRRLVALVAELVRGTR